MPFGLLEVDGSITLALGSGHYVKDGVAAFLEKRPPNVTGSVTRDMSGGYLWRTQKDLSKLAKCGRRIVVKELHDAWLTH